MSTEDVAAVTVASCDLRRVLSDVLPFADRDPDTPIAVVCLEAVAGTLTATATDRYTLGHSRAACEGALNGRVVISRMNARMIRRVLPCGPRPHPTGDQTTLTVIGDILDVRAAVGSRGEVGFRVPLSRTTFPDYPEILKKPTDKTPGRPLGFTPHFLARFAKVGDRYGQPLLVFTHDPTSPVFVEVGKTFIGVIMPVKLPDTLSGPTVPIGPPDVAESAVDGAA